MGGSIKAYICSAGFRYELTGMLLIAFALSILFYEPGNVNSLLSILTLLMIGLDIISICYITNYPLYCGSNLNQNKKAIIMEIIGQILTIFLPLLCLIIIVVFGNGGYAGNPERLDELVKSISDIMKIVGGIFFGFGFNKLSKMAYGE